MRLSKTHKYILLCEDKQMHCFIRRFLLSQGIEARKINALPLPADGCGEQYVRLQFPRYLKALRSHSFDSNVLVTVIDADKKSLSERKTQLNEACEVSDVPIRTTKDKLILLIPKRNIETWIKCFNGDAVDEEQDYAHFLKGHESDCYVAADRMSQAFSTEGFVTELASLQEGYKEYSVLIQLLVS